MWPKLTGAQQNPSLSLYPLSSTVSRKADLTPRRISRCTAEEKYSPHSLFNVKILAVAHHGQSFVDNFINLKKIKCSTPVH